MRVFVNRNPSLFIRVLFTITGGLLLATLTPNALGQETEPESPKLHGSLEMLHPDLLEQILDETPVAFVPLGTFEHHGWHLPIGFDGIKARALCERTAAKTGGVVLPTFFYGTGGGHIGYRWTFIHDEEEVATIVEATIDRLADHGFKTIVVLTGHYAREQVAMVRRLAEEANERHPGVTFIGLSEPQVTTPDGDDRFGGDHAAKYETSIAMALNPEWAQLDRLTPGRDPERTTLPDTPRREGPAFDPNDPLYAVYGQDPRTEASQELGERIVNEIVDRLAEQVNESLSIATPEE
jgi:creatinine amidohydrolase